MLETKLINSTFHIDIDIWVQFVPFDSMEKWFHKWGFIINENRSTHVTFMLRKQTCPQVTINNTTIPNKDTVKYLGITLDRRLTWKQHITDKSKQLKDKLKDFIGSLTVAPT